MSSILLIIQVLLAVILTIVILLQKSASIGLGAYSGSNESLFGAKGPAGFLAKFTFFMGFLFVVNTIALGYTYNQSLRDSVVDSAKFDSIQAPLAPNTNIIPTAPAAPTAENNTTAN